jgi:hypothetical protein
MGEATLYERLGGIFAIAAVIDNFSDRLVKNPIERTETWGCRASARAAPDCERRHHRTA